MAKYNGQNTNESSSRSNLKEKSARRLPVWVLPFVGRARRAFPIKIHRTFRTSSSHDTSPFAIHSSLFFTSHPPLFLAFPSSYPSTPVLFSYFSVLYYSFCMLRLSTVRYEEVLTSHRPLISFLLLPSYHSAAYFARCLLLACVS